MELYQEILAKLTQQATPLDNDAVKFSSKHYQAISFSKENFQKITAQETDTQICFIDGGNNELIGAPNFSLQLIRVAGVITKNNKTTKIIKKEYFLLAKTTTINNEIYFTVETFPLPNPRGVSSIIPKKEHLTINSIDASIRNGNQRASISKVAEISRKFSEHLLAKEMLFFLDKNDIIVLDNSLKAIYPHEEEYLNELYEQAIKQQTYITGLCKTTSLLTQHANSVVTVLDELSKPLPSWVYYPVAKINDSLHQAELTFVKLNAHAKHIFKFEIHNKQFSEELLREVVQTIAHNATDYVFPGYPYGLVVVDREARVSNKEKEYFRMKILSSLKNKDVEQSLHALDAHSILDSISF